VANSSYETHRQTRMRRPWRPHYVQAAGHYVVRNRKTREIDLRTACRDEAARRREELNAEHPSEWSGELIATDEVLEHLAVLKREGLGLKTVARISGVSRNVVVRIAQGEIRRTRRSTAGKLLAVIPSDAVGRQLIDAAPTWNLIECLLAGGWTRTSIARTLGSTTKTPTLQLRQDRVYGRTARRVEQLHEEPFLADPHVRLARVHAKGPS
jgi:hypothetical protein